MQIIESDSENGSGSENESQINKQQNYEKKTGKKIRTML